MDSRDSPGSLGRDAQMIRYRLDFWRSFGRNANGRLLIHAAAAFVSRQAGPLDGAIDRHGAHTGGAHLGERDPPLRPIR
jgi:hypothetical protein